MSIFNENPKETGEHYKGNGTDLIDHWQNTNKPNTARAKQISQIERYYSHYGEKNNPLVEAKKILDYATRLFNWELQMEDNK